MNSANEDRKSFKTVVQSLGIISKSSKDNNYPEFTAEEYKNSTPSRFHKNFLGNKAKDQINFKNPTYHSTALPSNLNGYVETGSKSLGGMNIVKDYVNKFVKGYMDSKGFEAALKEKNINPHIEEISKHIRKASSGQMGHSDLMFSVMKYKDW